MLGRHKLLILITAVLLIPLLLGMTPVNFVHKLSNGCPCSHGKQIQRSGPCLFHSVIPHDDLTSVTLNSIPLDHELLLASLDFKLFVSTSLHPNSFVNSIPLRC